MATQKGLQTHFVPEGGSALTEGTTNEAIIQLDQNKANSDVISSGIVFPSSPSTGQLFLHAPTGRKILYQYDGSTWQPLISYGTMSLYVDTASGTDDTSHGTGAGSSAFATLQYAVDTIPGLFSGNVTVSVASGTYSEDVIIRGKQPTGNYDITINGTLSLQETASSATVAAGTGATRGTVTKVGQFAGDSYAGLLAYFATDDSYRLISSHTDDVLTLVGTAPSSTTQDVSVYGWDTIITSITLAAGQTAININDCKLSKAGIPFNTNYYSDFLMQRCHLVRSSGDYAAYIWGGSGTISTCYTSGGVRVRSAALVVWYSSIGNNSGTYGFLVQFNASLTVTNGCEIDSVSNGILCAQGAQTGTTGVASTGYNRITNCTTGIYADRGGQVTGTTNNQYSGNSTDENGVAASYGYVD